MKIRIGGKLHDLNIIYLQNVCLSYMFTKDTYIQKIIFPAHSVGGQDWYPDGTQDTYSGDLNNFKLCSHSE